MTLIYNATDFSANGITSAISANGALQGGIVNIQAGHNILMNAGEEQQPEWYASQAITANGTATTNGRGGFISLQAGNSRQVNNVQIEAKGGLRDGTVSLNP